MLEEAEATLSQSKIESLVYEVGPVNDRQEMIKETVEDHLSAEVASIGWTGWDTKSSKKQRIQARPRTRTKTPLHQQHRVPLILLQPWLATPETSNFCFSSLAWWCGGRV